MKRLFFSFLFACFAVAAFAANNYYTASVFLNDGATKKGLATFVETESGDFILFKKNKESDVEKIQCIQIKKIVYTFDDKEYEYVYIKVYKGWKQVEIKGPIWLGIVKKGTATLYVTSTVLSSPGLMSSTGVVSSGGSATFYDYYIMRDGEPAAKLIATISSMNNNQTFKAKAPLYFSDYPELAKKIKDKTYTWKNLEEVVDIYNEWAAKH